MKLFDKAILFAAAGMAALPAARGEESFTVTSSSIVDGRVQRIHACGSHGGKDNSVELSITGIPTDASFITVVVDDPDAIPVAGKNWVHWNLFNVPASGKLSIPAGAPPQGDPGRSSGGSKGYEGMCPPNGTHTYRFAVFATKTKLEVGGFFGPPAMTIDYFESKFSKEITARSIITGKF
jgi:Raf kinase inhibitor-like YbhB/YbcL family protein